jgi:rhodanese-related sulfurtransferase
VTTLDTAPPGARTVDELLAQAREGLQRLSPVDTLLARDRGALLVDIRPQSLRRAVGEVPGSIAVERNVLEWRLDPRSAHRLDVVQGYDQEIVVICQEGYTSSLAAAALQLLGLHRATDLEGGVVAWRTSGLPLRPGGAPALP